MKSFTASILALNFATGTASCTGSVPAGNCLYCNAPDSCGLCKPDFFLNSTCASSTCNADPSSCKSGCQNDSVCCTAENCLTCLFNVAECTNCMPGFRLNNIECLACPGDCAACLSAQSCCPIHCAECLSVSSCNLCFSGSPPVANVCGCSTPAQNPKSPCATCNSDSSACLSCIDRYWLDTPDCSPCGNNCAACISGTVCTTCDAGFYKNGSNVCVACSAADCAECSDATMCTVCDAGFYLNSNACTACHGDCAACHTDADANNCCPIHCAACGSDDACTTCFSGESPVSDECRCSTPAQNPKSPCATCNSDFSACLTCIAGFYIDNDACVACTAADCAECSDATMCTVCDAGFYLNSNACTACHGDCAACHTNADANNCCPIHCAACGSDDACTICFSGESPDSDVCGCSTPAQNPKSPCATCNSDSSACLTCIDRYWLDTDSCEPCKANCVTCTTASDCTACVDGFYVDTNDNDVCKPCKANCVECADGTDCSACADGYYVDTNACVACPDNCMTCGGGGCTECDALFYLEAVCKACTANCKTCDAQGVCSECNTGHTLKDAACVADDKNTTTSSGAKGIYLAPILALLFLTAWKE